jgi:hypothetical protein
MTRLCNNLLSLDHIITRIKFHHFLLSSLRRLILRLTTFRQFEALVYVCLRYALCLCLLCLHLCVRVCVRVWLGEGD